MAKHSIVSFSVPEEQAEQLDALVERFGYAGRSALIRDALANLVEERAESGLSGTVQALVLFTHHHQDAAVHELRHAHEKIVRTTQHHHAQGKCVDVFMVGGEAKHVEELLRDARRRNLSVRMVQL